MWQFVLGHTVAGSLRGMYAGLLVLIMSLLTPVTIHIDIMLFVIMLLNGMMFSSLGVAAAIVSRHMRERRVFQTSLFCRCPSCATPFFNKPASGGSQADSGGAAIISGQ
jgi:hypothetical protein